MRGHKFSTDESADGRTYQKPALHSGTNFFTGSLGSRSVAGIACASRVVSLAFPCEQSVSSLWAPSGHSVVALRSVRGTAPARKLTGSPATRLIGRKPLITFVTLLISLNPARWCCWGQVTDATKVSIVQRAAPLRSILASLEISGTPKLSARAT
jgi:hypothetical protein